MAARPQKRRIESEELGPETTPETKKHKQTKGPTPSQSGSAPRPEPPRTRSASKPCKTNRVLLPEVLLLEESIGEEITMACQESAHAVSKPPTADEFRAILHEGLATVARREQLEQVMDRVDKNTGAIKSLSSRITTIEDQISLSSARQEDKITGIEARLDCGTRGSDSREAAYDKARRSLRVWPIKGNDDDELDANFRDFAIEALQLTPESIRNTKYASIIRVRNSPTANVFLEVCVTFQTVEERDFYLSRARLLAEFKDDQGRSQAGIRLDIPPFLMSTFKILNGHGHEIRNMHGRDTKRYIKFDEDRLTLMLEVRLPSSSKWIRITPEQARSYAEEKDLIDYNAIRRDLLRSRPAVQDSRQLTVRDSRQSTDNPNLVPLGNPGRSGSLSSISSGASTGGSDNSQRSSTSGGSRKWIPPGRPSSTRSSTS